MARKGHGRPASLVQIAGSGTTYPDDGSSPVGSNEWNANRDTTGVLGFTKKTEAIASNAINVTDSFIEVTNAGEIRTLDQVATALSTDYYPSDTSTKSFGEGDLLYLVKATAGHTITLKHQYGSSGGAGKITTLTGGDLLLDVNIPRIFMCRTISGVQEWIEYGGGTASDLDTTNFSAAALVTASDTIASNDNDTTIPTSAAVKDLIEAQIATEDTIAELNDTTISGIASGELLKWSGSAWVNQTLTEAGIVDGNLGTPSALVGTNISGTAANLTAGIASTAVTVSNDAITGAKLADDAVDSEHYTDGSIDLAHLAADSVDGTKIADDAINSEHYAAGSIDTAHIANLQITTGLIAADAITAAKIGDNIINSEHYAAGSIDNEHLADDAVGVDELSATGTASNSTFLRGDNAWTAVSSYATPTIGSTAVPSGTTQDTIAGLTLTSPVFNTGVSGSAVIDSDTMSGASATTVSSSESIKAYVDSSVAANVTLKGTYNASTDDPSLDDGSPIAGIVAGDHYIVSVAGTFFSEVLQVGDSVIAKQDSPTTFAHWITVNSNIVTPIVGANIADDAIDSDHYAAGSIDTAHIANLQVTTALIAADAINGDKIADDAIGAEHIAANAVVQASLADDAVGAAELASDAVVTASIVDLNVTTAKIAADAITSAKIADDQIDSDHYATGSIDSAHIANDQIDSQHYADGSIDNAHIADDQIDSEHYAAGSIDTAHIADDQITLAKMASGTAGNVITYDASGNPAAVVTGTAGQILTSAGSGQPPTFATASGSFVATATADLTFGGDYDIIDLQRLSLETQDDSWDTDSDNAAIANETQLYARAIDSNNDGIFARIKKNGSSVYLQIA